MKHSKSHLFKLLAALAAASMALGAAATLSACGAPDASSSGTSGASISSPSSDASSPAQSEAPALLGEFTASDLDGNEVDQSIFEGRSLTMINIWATFCTPCLNEMPDLGAIHQEYADKDFQVVGIVIDVLNRDGTLDEGQVELAKEIVGKTGADYLHLLPSNDLISAKLAEVSAVPETIFVDETGSVVGESYRGARSKAEWQKIIDQLLEQVGEGA